jgi:ribosomal protein S18 acetylase RimI-like enzyme
MHLAEATAASLDAIIERWYALATEMEAHDGLNKLTHTNIDEVNVDHFREHLGDSDITNYRVIHEDETIGFITLREGCNPSRRYSHYIRIVNLYIDEKHRSQGHGTDVVEHVKEIARERDCDHLTVSCDWHNEEARRFYDDTDFRPKQIDYVQRLE